MLPAQQLWCPQGAHGQERQVGREQQVEAERWAEVVGLTGTQWPFTVGGCRQAQASGSWRFLVAILGLIVTVVTSDRPRPQGHGCHWWLSQVL